MLKELKTQHRTIIQMVFSGFSNNEIAERLEMNPASVSQIIRSPLGQAYLGGLNDKAQEDTLDVRKKLTSLNKSALATFERILDPRQKAPHAVQATVAKDILDRNGYKPPDKINIDMSMSVKTDAEIDAEINALESAINKTYKQDPIKIAAEQSKDFIPAIIDLTRTKASAASTDSYDPILNQNQDQDHNQEDEQEDGYTVFDDPDHIFIDDPIEIDFPEPEPFPELDFSELDDYEDYSLDEELLSKVPASIFNSRNKVS